jgi:outer membrane protein assembly factor BamB
MPQTYLLEMVMKYSIWTGAALMSFFVAVASLPAADWPAFRGPNGAAWSADKDLPVQWSAENLLWNLKLPGVGASSPITYGDNVFVTSYAGYGTTLTRGMSFGPGKGKGPPPGKGQPGKGKGGKGKGGFGSGGFGGFGGPDTGGDQKKLKLLVLCVDAKNGQIRWKKEIEPKLPEMKFSGFLREHGYASSTPVTDGERVYVFFGKSGVFAFDFDGKQVWQADVGSGIHMWGSAASPILYKDLVIVDAAMESKALVALDKKTGQEIWRTPGIGNSWASPLLVKTKDGRDEIVLSLPGKVAGYDPDNGKELWHCEGIGRAGGFGYTCSTPVAKDGVVYVTGGGGPAPTVALAVRAGGRGDVTKTHVLWRKSTGTGIASPVITGDYLCWVAGGAYCLRTDTGETVYKERLYDGFGEYVSPVIAGDKIFALTRFDGLFVLAVPGNAGSKFEKLAHNTFEGDDSIFNASPAISNGRIYLRSNANLYCIGKK